jgi:acetyl-CoA carboxylase carboxyl transferase subunit alpha
LVPQASFDRETKGGIFLQMRSYLDFEKPVAELEAKVEELRAMHEGGNSADIAEDIARLEAKAAQALKDLYAELTPWQKTQVARHPQRPHCLDYVGALVTDFVAFAGDRKFGEDEAIVGGFGRFRGESICIIGHEKGSTTEARLKHNFGMARPEGYRKAVRLMEMADRFDIPVLALVDTAGAYPGIGAEERGQAEAIALNLREMARLTVPVLVTVTGEGGSGGALALGVGNRVNILEYAVYSVISPEGCAAILWRDATKSREAAQAMKLTAPDLKRLDVVDEVIPEVKGGAHVDPAAQAAIVADVLERQLAELERLPPEELVRNRYDRFRKLGVFDVA